MRCPKCTLMPPCKHYQTGDQILNDAGNYFNSKQFKQNMSPRKLAGLRLALDNGFDQSNGFG